MKIITIIGARPQFIKAATVSRAISNHNASIRPQRPSISEVIVHTGQHFDENMSEVFFRELAIPEPNYNLGIGGGSHGQNTGRMLEAIENVLIKEHPDWVMVYGDTDSTLAGALAAVKLCLPVAHVEAGLRSFNRRMPEEVNRVLTDHASSLLLCPTETAVQNLVKDGLPLLNNQTEIINHPRILKVGDVMYDAALFYSELSEEKSGIIRDLKLLPTEYTLATIHRAENTDDPERLAEIMAALEKIGGQTPLILPLHPRTRQKLTALIDGALGSFYPNIRFIDPVGYLDMVMLEKNAKVIITDSGGVQKEAYFHGVPCVTVRDETEWVELVDSGANFLAGADCERIVDAYHAMKNRHVHAVDFYGDGNAAEVIVNALAGLSGVVNQ